MSNIEIKSVVTKKEFNQFLKFPWKIYKNDKNWVPPLLMEKKDILNKKKNPFFQEADMEMFLASRDGELVGRIAAIKNDAHNRVHNENIGFFGFFECINNQEVANELLDTAKKWLIKHGFNAMRGPANPSSNDEYALLIQGFDDPPRIMMTYNPEYYMDLLDNYGLKKAKDLLAFRIDNEKLLGHEKLVRVAEYAKKRANLKIRSISMKDFKNELEHVKYVYNKAWSPNWGFVPMTEAEIDSLAKNLKPLVEPNIVFFGEIDGKIIGFALGMLDYNEIFKNMNGRLFPFGFLKLFTQKKKITWARIIILGLIPEYQKKGLDAVFYYECAKRAEEIGILKGEASWILEDNDMMVRGAEAMKGEVYKKYRVYQMDI